MGRLRSDHRRLSCCLSHGDSTHWKSALRRDSCGRCGDRETAAERGDLGACLIHEEAWCRVDGTFILYKGDRRRRD